MFEFKILIVRMNFTDSPPKTMDTSTGVCKVRQKSIKAQNSSNQKF